MPVKYKIKKDDPVVVISGKDKTIKSKDKKDKRVISVDKDNGMVVVENVNVVKRHTKPNQNNPDGGILDKVMPISISNVMYFCKKCDKGVRLGIKLLENGRKARYCKSCGEVVDKA